MQCDVEMPTSGQAHPAADKLSASQSDVDLRYSEHATYHRIIVTRRGTCVDVVGNNENMSSFGTTKFCYGNARNHNGHGFEFMV